MVALCSVEPATLHLWREGGIHKERFQSQSTNSIGQYIECGIITLDEFDTWALVALQTNKKAHQMNECVKEPTIREVHNARIHDTIIVVLVCSGRS